MHRQPLKATLLKRKITALQVGGDTVSPNRQKTDLIKPYFMQFTFVTLVEKSNTSGLRLQGKDYSLSSLLPRPICDINHCSLAVCVH